MIIEFEDHWQDFLEWELNEKGVVIASRPCQTSVWEGSVVMDFKNLQPGDLVHYYSKHDGQLNTIKYPIKNIKKQ